jgi:peroxiredoxin
MPALERLWQAMRGDPFMLVGISTDTNAADASAFMRKLALTFPLGLDPQSRVAGAYSVRAFPTTVIVGHDGNTVAVALGPRAWDGETAKTIIRELLKR